MNFTRDDSVLTVVDYVCETYQFGDSMDGNRQLARNIGVGLPQLREAMTILKARRIITIEHGKRKIVISDPLGSEEHY